MQTFMDKLSAWSLALSGIILAFVAGGYLLFVKQYSVGPTPSPTPDGIACTADAKLCPDGSAVGRTGPNCEFSPCPGEPDVSGQITYRNDTFGFQMALPPSWQGYTINHIKDDMYDLTGKITTNNGVVDSLQLIEIHHPLEVPGKPRQVIPIMVFTHVQWECVMSEKCSVGAAPIPPSELGRNSQWVMALPARYNYAFPEGWEEVEDILENYPLITFELGGVGGQFCGGIAGIICQDGYECMYDGKYPDAGGVCVKSMR